MLVAIKKCPPVGGHFGCYKMGCFLPRQNDRKLIARVLRLTFSSSALLTRSMCRDFGSRFPAVPK
jgi:hypothetical protein